MLYDSPSLRLQADRISDAHGAIGVEDLPDPQPRHPLRLQGTTPLIERLWRIALDDIERNLVTTDDGIYFGAGANFGFTVYTRDISYAGMLALNRLYPDQMLASLEFTRRLRRRLGFTVARGYVVPEIAAPWQEEDMEEQQFRLRHRTNSYTRRTDDVVWLWCAADLLGRTQAPMERWRWLYTTGEENFRDFYAPFRDPDDGLYRGQASFIDVHFRDHQATGYPQDWSIADCVLIKSLSTNSLYVLGHRAMATAARHLGLTAQAEDWDRRADAIAVNLRAALRREDGSLAWCLDRHGRRLDRCEALGSALAVLAGVVRGEEAR